MTNTPERISKLSAAILDMAEQNRGLIKSELDELIFQHCAAAEIGDCEEFQPFVPKTEHYVKVGNGRVTEFNIEPGSLNYVPEVVRERWRKHILTDP